VPWQIIRLWNWRSSGIMHFENHRLWNLFRVILPWEVQTSYSRGMLEIEVLKVKPEWNQATEKIGKNGGGVKNG
jgi:hypothetical protein